MPCISSRSICRCSRLPLLSGCPGDASQGWLAFVWFIAVLSTAVGLLNLFPIPVLDGGHLVFHAWEAMTGRPPSDRVLRLMMGVGLALMGTLMVFALSNDLFCP